MNEARAMLDLAARAALRGFGDVEPNPMVGAVVARGGRVLGVGHHRRFGGIHAEVDAIANCRRRGEDPRGGVIYVTLEPCDHTGKQPACSRAVIEAGLVRVVMARVDPNPVSAGGSARLRAAGIGVDVCAESELAVFVGQPFVKRITTGSPWVIAKWAQTIDGKVATRTGYSKWISGEASRRQVHRLRAGVDAVLTGVGTVLADDPMLTARDVGRVRRRALRVIVDPRVETPAESALVRSVGSGGEGSTGGAVLIVTTEDGLADRPVEAARLRACGADVVAIGRGRVNLPEMLSNLMSQRGVSTVLVESGPKLLGSLFSAGLVDQALVHVSPTVLGDQHGLSAVNGWEAARIEDGRRMRVARVSRIGSDIGLWLMPTMEA